VILSRAPRDDTGMHAGKLMMDKAQFLLEDLKNFLCWFPAQKVHCQRVGAG